MEESIKEFSKQLAYNPVIENKDNFVKKDKFILCGMGGSHLAAGLIKMMRPGIELYVHRDYGLPPYDEDFLKNSLLIASSYSGNTEEVLDFLEEGYSKGYDMAVISTGGKLIDFAKENNIPYVKMPDDGIQPRTALGYSSIALSFVMDKQDCLDEIKSLEDLIDSSKDENEGKNIAESLSGRIPVIYSSLQNREIAYNWKIKMNETGKVPAFYNVIPELNHNEMQGFQIDKMDDSFKELFHVFLLKDKSDHVRNIKRMDVIQRLYEEQGIPVTEITLNGETVSDKFFKALFLADWIAIGIAKNKGIDPEKVPFIEDFKNRMLD